jgi:hypothetical protein
MQSTRAIHAVDSKIQLEETNMGTSTILFMPITTKPITPKRNRHTVENDLQTALIKRINRLYAKRGCDRKVRVVNGQPQLFVPSDGGVRPNFFDTLDNLWTILNSR